MFYTLWLNICLFLHDLVPFLQLKKRQNHPWSSVKWLKPAILRKAILLHDLYNATKLRNASHLFFLHTHKKTQNKILKNYIAKKRTVITSKRDFLKKFT